MIKLMHYYPAALLVLLGVSCSSELRESSDQKVIQSAVSFIDALKNERFAEAYEYLHPKFKKRWERNPVTLWNFSDFTSASRFTLPDDFVSKAVSEGKQHEWPKYLFAEIMKLAYEQNAFPIDITALSSGNGTLGLSDADASERIYTITDGGEIEIRLFMSVVNESWKILRIEQLSNGLFVSWPKGESK